MRERSKLNFRYATHFFGETSKIGKQFCIEFACVTVGDINSKKTICFFKQRYYSETFIKTKHAFYTYHVVFFQKEQCFKTVQKKTWQKTNVFMVEKAKQKLMFENFNRFLKKKTALIAFFPEGSFSQNCQWADQVRPEPKNNLKL